jgi:hypothetical protein
MIPFTEILCLSLCSLKLLFFQAEWIWHDNCDTGAHSLAYFQNFRLFSSFFLALNCVRQSGSYVIMQSCKRRCYWWTPLSEDRTQLLFHFNVIMKPLLAKINLIYHNYKEQSVNAVQGSDLRVLWDLKQAHKFTVWEKRGVFFFFFWKV